MAAETLALVGATGGAGATRTAVEVAGLLGLSGERVAVVDADFRRQGLRRYVEGPIQPDLTTVLTEDGTLEEASHALGLDVPGRVEVCPADAPFERQARAQTAGAARAFEERLAAAELSNDVVIVDAPPVDANQAVAVVTSADRIALVAPDSDRGRDGVALVSARVADVDASVDAVLARSSERPGALPGADAGLPEFDGATPREQPTGYREPETADALRTVSEAALDRPVDVSLPEESGSLDRFVPGR